MLKNALVSIIAPIIKICGAFILTPLVLNSLGDESFSIWKVVMSLLSMSWLLQLGFNSYVNRVIPYYGIKKDKEKIYKAISTIKYFYSWVTLLILICGVTYLLNNDQSSEFNLAFFITLSAYIIFTPFSYERGILTGYLRFSLLSKVDVLTYIVYLCSVIIISYFEYDKVYFYIAATLPILLPVLLIHKYIIKHELQLAKPKKASFSEFKSAFQYSINSLIFTMSGMLFLNISIFIIFDKYELSSLTLYLLLIQIIGILSNLTTIMISTIKPQISKYHAENDWASIQKVFLSGLKYIALFSFLFSFYSYFYIYDVIYLWIGRVFTPFENYVLLSILLGNSAWGLLQMNYFICNGLAKHRFISLSTLLLFIIFYTICFLIDTRFSFFVVSLNIVVVVSCLISMFYTFKTLNIKLLSLSLIYKISHILKFVFVVGGLIYLPTLLDGYHKLIAFFVSICINLLIIWYYAINNIHKSIVKEKFCQKLLR